MRNRGSISVSILIGSFFLAMLAQIALLFITHSTTSILGELENYQLRKICGSVVESTESEDFVDGTENWPEITLEPGHHKINVNRTIESSEDNLINYIVVGAHADNDKAFYMRKLKVTLPSILQEKVKDYAVIYRDSIAGQDFLNNGTLYTSMKEEVLPNIKFLNGKALPAATSETAAQDGLSSKFYYLPSNNDFTFKANGRFYGSTVFANFRTINISNNCIFYDRVLLVSDTGNINIGKNVNLKKAIIVAYGTVTIDSGSKINGLIVGQKIIFKGPVQISRDEEVVTPFSSAYFLTNQN